MMMTSALLSTLRVSVFLFLVVRVEHAETHLQGAVDGRAVMQVLRGYPRRGHGEVGNLALLKPPR